MSHTLNTNVNVAKARTMLSMVSGATYVDSSLLLEDDGFCTLLTKLSHTVTVDQGVEALTEYVNNNY
jgi:hypothetical protein